MESGNAMSSDEYHPVTNFIMQIIGSNEYLMKSHSLETAVPLHHNLPQNQNEITSFDRDILARFIDTASTRAKLYGVQDSNWRMQIIAAEARVHLSTVSKCLYLTMWVAFLEVTREYIPADAFKYKTLGQFLAAYPDREFFSYPEQEQICLMDTANWMSILFKMEKSKKNKGLAMDVIPRLIEGPMARYVTGSGQTQATTDRVRIYEVEGNIEPLLRGKRKLTDNDSLDVASNARCVKRRRESSCNSIRANISDNQYHMPLDNVPMSNETDDVINDDDIFAALTNAISAAENCATHESESIGVNAHIKDANAGGIDGGIDGTANFVSQLDQGHSGDADFDHDRIFHQPTDRCELVALLDTVGGPENPAELSTDVTPSFFSPEYPSALESLIQLVRSHSGSSSSDKGDIAHQHSLDFSSIIFSLTSRELFM